MGRLSASAVSRQLHPVEVQLNCKMESSTSFDDGRLKLHNARRTNNIAHAKSLHSVNRTPYRQTRVANMTIKFRATIKRLPPLEDSPLRLLVESDAGKPYRCLLTVGTSNDNN
jgi:hypothetical protein